MSTFWTIPSTTTVEPSFSSTVSSIIDGAYAILDSIRRPFLGRHPRRSSQTQSLLLQLPIDLLFEISEFLPEESSFAFAITCTSLFGVLLPNGKLHRSQLDQLLQLLERELSKQLFFCEACHILHHFCPSWRPAQVYRFDAPCRPKLVIRDGYNLDFNFARLAMNKHILGGGLNLDQFECSLPNQLGGWNLVFEARVIQNELYLRVSHRISLNGTSMENRQQLQRTRHGICNHIKTHESSGSRLRRLDNLRGNLRYTANPQRRRIPELVPGHKQHSENWFAPTERRDARGSCPVCLTDYSITANQKDFSDVSELTIVIIAYHQLGSCRSRSDWKWLTFATPFKSLCTENMDASLLRKRYEDGPYTSGSVKYRWDQG